MSGLHWKRTKFSQPGFMYEGPSLAAVLASPPTRFVLKWGGGLAALSLGKHEASVVLSYSPFDATGVALSNRHASGNMQSVSRASVHPGGLSSSQGSLLQGSVTVKPGEPKAELHSKERSALLIKLVGNLHYYAEGGDECRSQFLKIFVEGLRNHPPLPGSSQRPEQIHINLCENLFTLVDYVATFPEELVTDEDLHLVRDFSEELHSEVCRVPSAEGCDEEDIICFYKMHNNRQIKLKEARKNNPRFRRLDGLRRDNLANARLGEEADDIVRQEWVEEDRGMIEYLRSSGPEPDGGLPEDLNNRLAEDRERGTGAADESSVRRDQTLTLFLGEPEPWVDNSSHCSLPANQEHREKEQCLEPSERMLARRTDLELRQPRDTPLDHLWAVQTLEGGMQQEEERQLGYAKEPRKDIRGNLTSKANDEDHDENVDDGHGNEHGADDNDDDAGPMEELSAQRRDFSGHQQIRSLRGRASGIRRKDGEDSSQHEKEEKAKRSDKTSLESDGQEALQGEFEEDGNEEEGEEETADEFAEEEMPPELELWDRAKPSKRKREKEKESSRKEKRLRAAETEREEREGEDDVDVEKGDQQEPDDDDGEESRSKGVNAKKGRRKGRWGSKERGDVCGGGDDGGDPTDNFCGEDDKEAPPPVKRKGKLMNDQQLVCVESGLRQFPNMHKQSKVIEKFASKIKDMGPEVTPQQLRNWSV
ncbi:hypothetical protein CBR_g32449 [Chara braunii]|uniref:Uncharacterized protein n=1 Tax=Chara braunii TaxID=69332 RepID=A0A388LGM1_CHABU|nr:hypothetical protein CBR_g32449 [Chara braunii]|eukprot:GBG81458.1 hypothetical protein CBR_g32449 [Chara braunii]